MRAAATAALAVASTVLVLLLSPATCFVVPTSTTHPTSSGIGQLSRCDGGRRHQAGRAEQEQGRQIAGVPERSGAGEGAGRARGSVLAAVAQVCAVGL